MKPSKTLFSLYFGIAFLILSHCFTVHAKTRIAVSTLDDKSGNTKCSYRYFSRTKLGKGLRAQLVSELAKQKRFSIQERENLKKMHSEEHELINADRRYAPRKNRFKAAQYSITGSITSFELCASGLGGSVDVGGLFGFKNSGLEVGGKTSKAKVGLDIRIVDVETAEVLDSFTTEGTASSTSFEIDGDFKGADFDTEAFKNSPLGEATRKALRQAVRQITQVIPDRKETPRMAQQETRRKVTRPASKKRRRAKSASHASGSAKSTSVARRGETRHTHVCPHQRHSKLVSACRILKRSASGERVMALNLEEGKKITYKNDQILELKKRAQVAIGDSALLSCQTQGAGCSYAKKSYLKCLVADQFDDEYVINCNGQELQVTQRQLHFSQKVSSQVAQAE